MGQKKDNVAGLGTRKVPNFHCAEHESGGEAGGMSTPVVVDDL